MPQHPRDQKLPYPLARYNVTFVPEHGIEQAPEVVLPGATREDAITYVANYHGDQWQGERTPDLYGTVWSQGQAALAEFEQGALYAVAVPVEYGTMVIG